MVEPLPSAYKALGASPVKRKKIRTSDSISKYLIGTVNFSFQMTKVRTKFPFKCFCQNEVKISYLKLLKLLSHELIHHTNMLALSLLLASVIHLGVWGKQLKDNWGKHTEFLGDGEDRDASVIAWSVQRPHTARSLTFQRPCMKTLQGHPCLPPCTRAVNSTSHLHLQTGLGRQVHTWRSESSVSRLAASLWKHIRSTLVLFSLS